MILLQNEFIIATKNKGKIKEFKQLLNLDYVVFKSLYDFPALSDVEETGTTFQENAQLKAEQIAHKLQKPVIADDSGLVVAALNGDPGVYSARYAGEPRDDTLNNEKLLLDMKHVSKEERGAYFICVLALAVPGEETVFKVGKCHGHIAFDARGEDGFGYDPLFIPEGYEQTLAELGDDVKNKLSHRYRALVKMKQWLEETDLK